MLRFLFLCLALVCALAPADAARRRAIVKREPLPPIIWAQPPQAPPIPILVMVEVPAPLPVVVAAPPTTALPETVRELLDATARTNDQAAFAAVAKAARQTNPDNAGQIDALVAQNDARLAEAKAQEARARADRLASAAFLDLWKGEVELGGSRASGNSSNVGAYASASLRREGLRWRHALTGRFDYQRTEGATSTQRANIAYQPQYKVDERFFVFGIGQYEHDRLLGIGQRVTAGAGIGYTLVSNEALKVSISGGPAVRKTDYYDQDDRTSLAGRGSLSARWTIAPNLTLSQDAAFFPDADNSTANATTALDTKLIGKLKGRLSYNIVYESDPPEGRRSLDTLSRATLVYSF